MPVRLALQPGRESCSRASRSALAPSQLALIRRDLPSVPALLRSPTSAPRGHRHPRLGRTQSGAGALLDQRRVAHARPVGRGARDSEGHALHRVVERGMPMAEALRLGSRRCRNSRPIESTGRSRHRPLPHMCRRHIGYGRTHRTKNPTTHTALKQKTPPKGGASQCPETESNCRHEDFQSSALPTELSGRRGRPR